jgi:hypothetical protein
MAKETIITTTREQQQRYLMNCAAMAVFAKGRAWEARWNNFTFLLSLRENSYDLIKDRYNQELLSKIGLEGEVLDLITDCRNAVAEMVAYFSDIRKDVLSKEDVSSQRFLEYKDAVSRCYKYQVLIDSINVFLQKGTDLEQLTIPSMYWTYLTKEVITMPPESVFTEQSQYNEDNDEPIDG